MSLVVFIDELNSDRDYFQNRSVRVFGSLASLDFKTQIATITHRKNTLLVDTALLGAFRHRIKGWYQFLGVMDQGILHAKIIRDVEGMDQNVFSKALQSLRDMGLGYQGPLNEGSISNLDPLNEGSISNF